MGGVQNRRPFLIRLRAIVLIRLVAAALSGQIALERLGGVEQSLRPRLGHGPRLATAVLVKLALGFAQTPLTTLDSRHDPLGVKLVVAGIRLLLGGRVAFGLLLPLGLSLLLKRSRQPLEPGLLGLKLGRQLIPARLPVALILGLVGRDRLREDLPRDLVIVNIRIAARVRVDLRAIDRHDPRLHERGLRAQREHGSEQVTECLLVTLLKRRDRRVIRDLIGSDHKIRDVLTAVTLNI